MTIEELFPKSEFPLRAKTEVKLPGTDLIMRVSVFYQKPLIAFDDSLQIYGMCRVVSLGNKELMAEAALAENNPKEPRLFVCKWGEWVEITNDDHEIKQAMILQKLLLGYDFMGHPFSGLEDAEWKQF